MQKITQIGIELICYFESFSSALYFCPAGFLTIGYGHVVSEEEKKIFEHGITEEEGKVLLKKDLLIAERAVLKFVKVPLSPGQFDALVSFTFNVGSGALQRSTLRQKVNRSEHAEVPFEMMKWVWAKGKKQSGLVRRRKAEILHYQNKIIN